MNIVELDTSVTPSPSGSGELILAHQGGLQVVFWGFDHRLAVATFVNFAQLIFGYPNDEAREGIAPGLVYAFYEVLDSDWGDRLTEQNRIAFPDLPNAFNRRHFIMTCHETTLQVLASDVVIATPEGSFTEVAMEVLRRKINEEGITVLPHAGE